MSLTSVSFSNFLLLIKDANKLKMTKTTNATTISSSFKVCILAAVFCCLLAFFVPESVEAINVERCIKSTEKAVMYRNSDNQISCVKLSSVEKLEQRGWGSYNPLDPVMPRAVETGPVGRPYHMNPIFNQEIDPSLYDFFRIICAKGVDSYCSLHLNNGTTIQYLFNTDIKKYFTVNWDASP